MGVGTCAAGTAGRAAPAGQSGRGVKFDPKAQNSSKALHSTVLGPKSLKI